MPFIISDLFLQLSSCFRISLPFDLIDFPHYCQSSFLNSKLLSLLYSKFHTPVSFPSGCNGNYFESQTELAFLQEPCFSGPSFCLCSQAHFPVSECPHTVFWPCNALHFILHLVNFSSFKVGFLQKTCLDFTLLSLSPNSPSSPTTICSWVEGSVFCLNFWVLITLQGHFLELWCPLFSNSLSPRSLYLHWWVQWALSKYVFNEWPNGCLIKRGSMTHIVVIRPGQPCQFS